MKKFKNIHIIVIGCGRLGTYLANRFSHAGHSVVVIDSDNKSFRGLSVHFSGFRIEGDATELQVLKQAKVDKADLLLATTDDDNINLMVAQIASKIFKVPRVMARVYTPDRENIYREMGVDTICPTTVIGDLVSDIYVEEFSKDEDNERIIK